MAQRRKGWRRKECRKKLGPMFGHLFEDVAGSIGLFCYVLRILVGLNY